MASLLQIPSKNSALSSSYAASGKGASTTVTVPKILTVDTLTVKKIILLDSLFTKNDIDVSAINKLQISKGSIVNTLVSPNATKKALTFNNVYFEPDPIDSDIMTIYGLNDLNVGTTSYNLSLYGSNVSISSNNLNIKNTDSGNIVTNYIGSNISANIGTMQYNSDINEFQYFNNVQIFGNLEVMNEIVYSTIIINESNIYLSTINGNLIVVGEVKLLSNTSIVGEVEMLSNVSILKNLKCVDLNVLGELQVLSNVVISKSLTCTDLDVSNINVSRINSNLTVANNLTIANNLNVVGEIRSLSNLSISKNLSVIGEIQALSNIIISKDLTCTNLDVSNINVSRINSNLTIANNLSVVGDVQTLSNLSISKNLNVIGDVQMLSNLSISKNLTCTNLNVSNISASRINGNLTIANNLTVNNSIYTSNVLLNNKLLTTDTKQNLTYNSNIVLTVNSSNILNMSNVIIYDASNSQEVLLDVRGNIQCNAVFLTSNVEKKKDIRDITFKEINNVSSISSYNYNLKSNDTNNFGFLAHEVKNIYPMLSDGDSVNYIGFIPLLLEKIKIMENKINELESKIIGIMEYQH